MANSVLEAIQQGIWDYEPRPIDRTNFASTGAMPGTVEKLAIIAERVRQGLPLWHPSDRVEFDDVHSQF